MGGGKEMTDRKEVEKEIKKIMKKGITPENVIEAHKYLEKVWS